MSFFIKASPLFVTVPAISVPSEPLFQRFNVSLLLRTPVSVTVNLVPWLVMLVLAATSSLSFSVFTVPLIFNSPALFVIIAEPLLSTVPAIVKPLSPLFNIVRLFVLLIVPFFVTVKPLFAVIAALPLLAMMPFTSTAPFWLLTVKLDDV